MKKTLSIIAAGLLLAGCGSTPEAINYESREAWDGHLADTNLTCDNNKWIDHPWTGTTGQANCFDENGARIGRIMVSSPAEANDYVDGVIEEEWIIPALLKSDFWVVQCPTVPQCENWQGEMGGEILLYPDYSPKPA